MKNKKFRVAALVLCAVIFCLPLLGLAAPVQAEAKVSTYCDCTVRCTDAVKNPDCPGCALDRSICVGKERVCSCAERCAAGKGNADCPACSLAVWACTGKTPETQPTPPPTPVCACDVKCTDTTKNADCPVCAADIAGCKGKAPEPTPAPVCGCTVKCAAEAVNTACPVCKTDLTKCTGKAATPTPAPAGSYSITIVAPSGWYTRTAKVEIRVADENDTGWKKVDARIERNGSVEDLTDAFAGGGKVYVSISENCTVYVTVTGKDGKTTTKSRYIECFDRTAPTVKTGVSGKVLRVEATDELSGVDAVYIDGERYDDLTNGVLDVRLRDLGDDYDQLSVQAVDYAGNKSRTVQVKNPNYKAPSSDKDKPTPAPTPTPTPTPTTPPTTTAPGTTTTKPSGGNNAGSGGNIGGTSTVKPATTTGPEEDKEPNPFTPEGSGTVVDNATDGDGKEFYTIQTPAENVFYLVIDRQRGTENVYFLNAVTEADLAALAEPAEEPVTPAPAPEPEPEPTPAPDEQPEPEQPAKQSGGNMGMLLLVGAVVLIGGGAAWYFKIYRPKHEAAEPEEDFDEADFEDGDALWDEDGEQESGDEEEPTE